MPLVKTYSVEIGEASMGNAFQGLFLCLQKQVFQFCFIVNSKGNRKVFVKKSYGTLPEEVMGCSVEWNSSDESVITASGKVAAPPEKKKVELTAVITNGDTVLEHTYNVTVRPQ